MTLPQLLTTRLQSTLAQLLPGELPEGFRAEVVAAADTRFGDYQTNAAMVLAKHLKTNPRALAERIVAALAPSVDDVSAAPEIAGPGFVNFRIHSSALAGGVERLLSDPHLGTPQTTEPRTVLVDLSGPNVAKQMHVGHIRSTIIGDSLARVARFLGHKVITDNHIGDWGTQFGMVLHGWKHFLDETALAKDPITELLRIYKKVNSAQEAEPELREVCKAELVKLQSGDAENLAIWKKCVQASLDGLQVIYDKLDVKFDLTLGESHYNARLAPLTEELLAKGIAEISGGAVAILSDGTLPQAEDPFLVCNKEKQWAAAPCLIRKGDGGFLYATTDLATMEYRTGELKATDVWYVVGTPQALHFRQIFAVAQRMGMAQKFVHIGFGSILGEDGRMFKTRSGETVGLKEVLEEGIERARVMVEEKNPALSEEEKNEIAEAVGLGAVKYAELSQNRLTDYKFSWDKMLSMQGNTAPYLQNAYVRTKGIFRKLGATPSDFGGEFVLEADEERTLAVKLHQFGEMVPLVLVDFRPNILATYLYELASTFHSFFEACPVLKSEGKTKETRLALCELTSRVLAQGLGLLGIRVTERM
jgi:arginyl-tRNA synthetase